mmetsp:Transcript_10878/g.16565  ORF Transcript_10878/g.16565 Transcript_10878/m.16565 type:complete len:565 (-) Transcript_10878:132-1826(-)
MDITRENFREMYPIIRSKIETCSFIAFDEEMSGINADGTMKFSKDDIPDIRYTKMVGVASKYSIIQFGLCMFHKSDDGFTASPYNFYLFPDFGGDIVMSASSIAFLRKNNMNFSTWIEKGVTFADSRGEEWALNKYCPKEPAQQRNPIVLSSQSDIDFMERNMAALNKFISDVDAGDFFEFEGCNSYLRRCIYDKVEREIDGVVVKKGSDPNRLVAHRINPQDRLDHERKVKEQMEQDFFDTVGFRNVFKDIIASKKPVVGHNMLYDLMFAMRWLDSPLKETFDEFRLYTHDLFPLLYDTKYIESSGIAGPAQTETTLEQCYERHKKCDSVRISVHEDCSEFDGEGTNYHNAGYDAFCTGCVFARQVYIADGTPKPVATVPNDSASPDSSLLTLCANKVFMMWSLFNMDLNPQNPGGVCKYTGTLVRCTGFPRSVTTSSLLSLVSTSGLQDVEVVWVNDMSFFFRIPEESSSDYCEALAKCLPPDWVLQPFGDFLLNSKGPCDLPVDSEEVHHQYAEENQPEKSLFDMAIDTICAPFRWAAFGGDESCNDDDSSVQPSRKRPRN